MNFQQLNIIRESARRNYNLTEVANSLFTSQSGVSRHIRELEEELGIEIFIRRGKRLLGMTEPGKELLVVAERILNDVNNIRRLANVFTNNDVGQLVIATTHTQARYSLPNVVKEFRAIYPQVRLVLNQGTPDDIVAMLHSGEADIGIASEQLMNDATLAAFPYYRWHHAILVPQQHPPDRRANGDAGYAQQTVADHLSTKDYRAFLRRSRFSGGRHDAGYRPQRPGFGCD